MILDRNAPLPHIDQDPRSASDVSVCTREGCGGIVDHYVPAFVTVTVGGHDAIIEGVQTFVPPRDVQLSGIPVAKCQRCGCIEPRRPRVAPSGPIDKKPSKRNVPKVERACIRCGTAFMTRTWDDSTHCSAKCATETRRITRIRNHGAGGPTMVTERDTAA